jgi:hypothetical protein
MRSLLGLLLAAAACGGEDATPDAAPPIDGAPVLVDARPAACPPVALPDGGAGGAHAVFLQLEGVTLQPGAAPDAVTDTTPLVAAQVAVPPYLDGVPNRAARVAGLVDALRALLAPYDVDVVTARPAAPPYLMIVFGGDSQAVMGEAGLGGATTRDCDGAFASDVALVFDLAGDSIAAANLAAAWIGLAIGLSGTSDPGDCLCFSDPECTRDGTLCTFGTEATVAPDPCPGSGETQDETESLEAAFGCR